MSRLPRITAAELVRVLERDGWFVARRTASSHLILRHPTKAGRATVAMHPGETVKPKTLAQTLRDASLTVDQLVELLRG
jgi:predicted RNA binding protein YcfA (HicA-like mRNA interferase family)